MAYQLIPNLLVLAALVGLVVLVVRRVPEAKHMAEQDQAQPTLGIMSARSQKKNFLKRFWNGLLSFGKRIGHFMLEAKEMKKGQGVGEQVRRILVRPIRTSGLMRRTENAPKTQKLQSAEEKLLAAIKLNPKDYSSYNELGQLYLDGKNFNEAKKVYTYLVKHQRDNATFFAKLGFTCLQLGLYREAAVAYEQALGLDDTHPSRFYNLSLALMAESKHREAMRAVQKALHLDPHNTKYQQTLRQLLRLQQQEAVQVAPSEIAKSTIRQPDMSKTL